MGLDKLPNAKSLEPLDSNNQTIILDANSAKPLRGHLQHVSLMRNKCPQPSNPAAYMIRASRCQNFGSKAVFLLLTRGRVPVYNFPTLGTHPDRVLIRISKLI